MLEVEDQIGRKMRLDDYPAKRIVSLVPSISEFLFDLNLGRRIVGVTKFCISPPTLKQEATVVGGTKQVHFDRISALNPDLIIANKEENTNEIVQQLARDFPVWVSQVNDLSSALEMMQQIGLMVGKFELAKKHAAAIFWGFQTNLPESTHSAVYLIWQKPTMAAGTGTFIHEMMKYAGFENKIEQERYPEVTLEALQGLAPDYLLLSSEPFPFSEKHVDQFQNVLPNTSVRLVDGTYFSWYGSRMQQAPSYFRKLLNTHDHR